MKCSKERRRPSGIQHMHEVFQETSQLILWMSTQFLVSKPLISRTHHTHIPKKAPWKIPWIFPHKHTRWWIEKTYFYPDPWGDDPICLLFFQWVESWSKMVDVQAQWWMFKPSSFSWSPVKLTHSPSATEDTEDEAPRPPIPLIPDPLDEILKRHMAEIATHGTGRRCFFVFPRNF